MLIVTAVTEPAQNSRRSLNETASVGTRRVHRVTVVVGEPGQRHYQRGKVQPLDAEDWSVLNPECSGVRAIHFAK